MSEDLTSVYASLEPIARLSSILLYPLRNAMTLSVMYNDMYVSHSQVSKLKLIEKLGGVKQKVLPRED